jgi:molybdopterin-guanine dinucleotide biosynthesis protein B
MKVIGLVGSSGSGKTSLIAKLLPLLADAGRRISTVKHAHHGFDIDRPGKDSYLHRQAGAEEVMIVSDERWALMREQREEKPSLPDLIRRMTPVDIVLVEGFKHSTLREIEVYRPSLGKRPLFPDIPQIIAIASDDGELVADRPCLALDDPPKIAQFILTLPEGEPL